MQNDNEHIQRMKDILEKEHGREFTWQEAAAASDNLTQFASVLLDIAMEEDRRKRKLKDSPKGFHLNGEGYTCFVCGYSASNEDSWYDKYGIKCMTCQRAIDRKEIPASIAKNRESWYSKCDLEHAFNIKPPVLRRWVEAGLLKPRHVTNNGRVHLQLFLIKDNKDVLPPKDLVKDQALKVGENSFRMEPWYRFVDPWKHLKGYEIMNYMRETTSK
jgi:hypothetical protein